MSVKILHIITLSEWGGAQQVCYDIVTNLDKEKFSVEVACAPGGELINRLEEHGIVVHKIDSLKRDISPVNDLKALFALYRLIRKGSYDIVHCHSTKAGLLGRIAAWLARTPKRFFTVHGWGFYNTEEYGYIQRLLILFEKISGWVSTKVICVSKQVKEDGLKRKIAPEAKFTLIRNGTAWNSSKQEGTLRKEIEVDDKDILFGMVARLSYPKNPLLFLQGAEKVVADNDLAKFVLIGDGPFYKDCEEFVVEKGLRENVYLLGFRKNARQLFPDFDIFVLTSQFEGLPMTIIEAMFAGLPIIATDVGGVNELVEEGRNGLLTEPHNVDQLARKMMYLIENPEKRINMGKESHKTANENFTITKMIQEYEKLYTE